ncbi:TPA: hypothetical protein N0F65_011440 [Lagenidium giganteum]|uniref:Uncharacterized protein n=1 Tax=Lagenidium giganteum TaxID=4803 RepID=A0AAV2ZE56_9STRA|nr:TPA: hypothetical protein N0F65_011440 [Lagenidium giganteum]
MSLVCRLEAHHQQTETDVFAQEPQPKLEPGVALPASAPTHALPLGTQRDGTPFPLSKPIVREDGIILVGTELMSDQHQNRIFVTNMHSFHQSRPVASIPVPDSVCDLHWLNDCTAVVAVGKDVQLIRIGSTPGDRSCRLQPPINRVHSDTIREVALAQATTRPHVLSGGFDETVCVTQLDPAGDPKASVVVSKFDAHDVVSSVRWSPTEAQVSWTTDGGDFHMADIRLKPSHTQMPAASVVRVDQMGGLFTHEYLSCTSVVLGFEHGDLVFLDTRMPRASTCYHKMPSQLVSTGEIRRSKMGKLAVFGLSGCGCQGF